jgi:hypothetical protein
MDSRDIQQLQNMMASIKNRPEDEVVDEFATMIKSGKAGMSIPQAINLIGMVQPMLNAQQKSTMQKLMRKLK